MIQSYEEYNQDFCNNQTNDTAAVVNNLALTKVIFEIATGKKYSESTQGLENAEIFNFDFRKLKKM